MTPITINRSSWHYKLMRKVYWNPTKFNDSCTYIKYLAFALVLSMLGGALALFVSVCVLDLIVYGVVCFMTGQQFMMPQEAQAGMLFVLLAGFVVFIVLMAYILDWLCTHLASLIRRAQYNGKEPTGLSAVVKRFREKTCVPIEFK